MFYLENIVSKAKDPVQPAGNKAASTHAKMAGRSAPGDSGGGAYPNPHDNRKAKGKVGSFLGHGGQSEQGYYGADQIDGKKIDKSKDHLERSE